jgi:RHS repeat-associated protein
VPADNLGSIAVITDETGTVVERDGYDAWGKRRFPNGADDPTGSLTSQTTRGFTAQEELHDVGLVHLNGRVYDPLVARMMSADPIVDDPMNGQTWNRYSYVANNPLTFTDPSGYCFLGCGTMGNLGKMQLGTLFRQNPMFGSVLEIAATGICGMMTAGGCIPSVVAVLASATVAGITSGRLGKDVLRAGVTTAATVSAFYVVGGMTNVLAGQAFGADHIQPAFGTAAYDFNVVAHAAVGCGLRRLRRQVRPRRARRRHHLGRRAHHQWQGIRQPGRERRSRRRRCHAWRRQVRKRCHHGRVRVYV